MAKTTNLGLTLVPSTVANAENDVEVILANATANVLDAVCSVAAAAADGAIAAKQGLVMVTKSSAAAILTLALPTAGLPSASTPGDDGKKLTIMSSTAKAHTVTTPTAGVNGASTILTFAAAAANFVELVAYNGTWYVRANAGITIS